MNFKTHNDQQIDTNGSSLIGEVDAGYDELCNLFGAPTGGDGYKVDAEWAVLFDDGTVATIYNWKNGKNYEGENGLPVEEIRDWHIGGFKDQAETNVQIALDLHREKKEADATKDDKFKEAFGSVFDMFESLAKTKGVPFTRVVELAVHIRKKQELLSMLISGLVDSEAIPKGAGEALSKVDAMLSAKILGLACDLGALKVRSTTSADEIIEWADRIMEAEQAGAKNLFGDLFNKESDDA